MVSFFWAPFFLSRHSLVLLSLSLSCLCVFFSPLSFSSSHLPRFLTLGFVSLFSFPPTSLPSLLLASVCSAVTSFGFSTCSSHHIFFPSFWALPIANTARAYACACACKLQALAYGHMTETEMFVSRVRGRVGLRICGSAGQVCLGLLRASDWNELVGPNRRVFIRPD